VLLMLGDVEPSAGFALAKRYFDDIPPHAVPPRVDTSEPVQTEERRGEVPEKFAQLPAVAIGYHAPQRGTPEWFAAGILDRALHGGRAGRIYRRLVLEKEIAVETSGGINYPSGDLFDYNGPALMVTSIYHKPEFSVEQTVAAFDEIVGQVKEHGVTESELEQLKVKFRSDYFTMLEGGMGSYMPRFGLMHLLACFTLFDNEPEKINSVLDGFLRVSPTQVRDIANKLLISSQRSILIRKPVSNGGGR